MNYIFLVSYGPENAVHFKIEMHYVHVALCLQQLSAIHEQYHQMKCALKGEDATLPDGSLNIIQANLVQYITK